MCAASSISDEPSSSGEMSRQEEDDKRSPKDKEGKEKDSYRDEGTISSCKASSVKLLVKNLNKPSTLDVFNREVC